MPKGIAFAAGLAAVLFAANAWAQSEEIVVTGSRISENDATVPHVVLVKRADFLITRVRVTCDTRDKAQRNKEIRETLRAMIRGAKGPSIKLAVNVGDEIVTDFDETQIDTIIVPDSRPDSSVAQIIVKTAVTQADSYADATDRIRTFIEKVPVSGRTEVVRSGDWDLTIVGPEQYRTALLKLIAADSKATAEQFGADYGIAVEGLQRPVEWYQSAPLDLALFIRYGMTMTPTL